MAKVKLTCSERCAVGGVAYMPGTVEVDAETAALLLRCWPRAFHAGGGGIGGVRDGQVGTDPDAPAPEKRRKKPAKFKRKG